MKLIDGFSQIYIQGFIRALDDYLLELAQASNISKVQAYLEKHYLSQFCQDYKLINSGSWEGIDSDSQRWHNDSREGHNISFLIYLDQCSPEIGGQLEVKTEDFSNTIYPEPGLVVILNQSMAFKHRAIPSKKTRRVLSFDYFLNGLENK